MGLTTSHECRANLVSLGTLGTTSDDGCGAWVWNEWGSEHGGTCEEGGVGKVVGVGQRDAYSLF